MFTSGSWLFLPGKGLFGRGPGWGRSMRSVCVGGMLEEGPSSDKGLFLGLGLKYMRVHAGSSSSADNCRAELGVKRVLSLLMGTR